MFETELHETALMIAIMSLPRLGLVFSAAAIFPQWVEAMSG
jgi:hypothetical protein